MKIILLLVTMSSFYCELFSQYNFACNPADINPGDEAFFYLSTASLDLDSTFVFKCQLDNFGASLLDTIFSGDLLFQGIGIGLGENNTTTFFGELDNASCIFDAEAGTFSPFEDMGRDFAGHQHHIWASDTFEISYYNTNSGASFTANIYDIVDNQTRVKTADCAVDQQGNIWFVAGIDIPTDWSSHSIVCMDTTGTIVNTYNFEINTKNAYGMMFIGNDLFIGFGNFSQYYTNLLCKIDFNGNNAEIRDTFEFEDNYSSFNDLATCIERETNAIHDYLSVSPLIYPNPVLNELHFENCVRNSRLEILSATGKICYHQKITGGQHSIDMKNFKHGLYVVKIYDEFGKFIKSFRVVRS